MMELLRRVIEFYELELKNRILETKRNENGT